MEDCVNAELEKVKDLQLIQYVGEHIRNGRMRKLYESYGDSSFEWSKIGTDYQLIRDGLDDTSTIRGQKEKQKQKEKQLLNRRCCQVIDFYQHNFGVLSPFVAKEIGGSVDEIGEPLVMEEMKISLSVSKRNWRYTYGILKRWREEQVNTTVDMEPFGGISYLYDLQSYANLKKFDEYEELLLDQWKEREKRNILTQAKEEDWGIQQVIQTLHLIDEARIDDHLSISTALAEIYEAPWKEGEQTKGTPTGINRLDQMTSAFQAGELTVIAAKPSMGKPDVPTASLLNINEKSI